MSEVWAQQALELDEQAVFRVGQLRLLVARGLHDWSLAWSYGADDLAPALAVSRSEGLEVLGDGVQRCSHAFPHSQGPLVLAPLLADRPVIVRPVHDVVIAPHALVQLYVTTSLWVGVGVEGGEQTLSELPCVRPKQTWFGPNTLEGELCYAGRLPLCHHAEGCAGQPHRAITPLLIRNRSSAPLAVLRARLPVPRISLFRTKDGGFWTSRVSVVRKEGSDEVDVEVLPRAPDEAGGAALVAPARVQGGEGVVSRTLGSVFSHSLIP